MVRIMNWKEFSEEGMKKILRGHDITEESVNGIMEVARNNPGKIIQGELTLVTLKYESSEGKMRWYFLL